ncbi:MAG: hypothetical protein ACO3WU_15060 [Ilumatobacteraceae bacterium]
MRRWITAPVLAAALIGCSSGDEATTTTTVDAGPASTATSVPPADTDAPTNSAVVVDLDLGELLDVRPERVLLAAAIIATGDIDDAVAEGLVSPAEVDAAIEAIENRDLARWQDLADG